jgi:hypothetical protein
MTNPGLDPAERTRLTEDLMRARRAIRSAQRTRDGFAAKVARADVDRCKRALGERGDVWWSDGAPDYNRHMARNTPYAEWIAGAGSRGGGARNTPTEQVETPQLSQSRIPDLC